MTAEAIASGADLSGYGSLVVADMELPPGSTADRDAYVAGLRAFAQSGGQLVLTDRAVGLVSDLTPVPDSAETVDRTDAGHVDFLAPLGDHPYEAGLVGKPSQTYYEVMLGYPSQGSAPNYGVTRTAWEAAGGTTVATVGAQGASTSPNTALGSMPLGAGRVTDPRRAAAAGDRGAGPRGRQPHRHPAPVRPGRLRRHHHRRPGPGQRPGLPAR